MSELVFYPLLLLSLFQFVEEYVEGNGFGGISDSTWAKFIIGTVQDLGPVYLSRMFILGGSIWSIQKVRNAVSEKKKDEESGGTTVQVDNAFHWKGACFQVMFVAQAYGQMLIQIMLIITIVSKYYFEYTDFTEQRMNQTMSNDYNPTLGDRYALSPQLIYMMVVAFITPVLGMIIFLLVHHFWTQNFPIKLILDMLELLKSSDWADTENVVNMNKTAKEFSGTMRKMMFFASDDNIQKDYEDFQKIPIERKLLYPFASPLHVIVTLLYGGLLLGFGICTLAGPEEALASDWVKFYVVETVVILLVNFYALLIAIVWTVIIAGIIIIIILVIFIACLLIGCSSSGSQRQRQY